MKAMLGELASVEIVAEADGVAAAVRAIESCRPDVVFLDIELAGESGFDVVERIDPGIRVVFVTAYNEHAVRAFEINALDYLLKPVRGERLRQAIERVTSPVPRNARSAQLQGPLGVEDHIFLPLPSGYRFLRIGDIRCLRAATPYSELHTGKDRKIQVLKSLSEWEKRLPDELFVRIHRSTIVNVSKVTRVEEWFNYTFRVYLEDSPEPLAMSRRYARRIKGRI